MIYDVIINNKQNNQMLIIIFLVSIICIKSEVTINLTIDLQKGWHDGENWIIDEISILNLKKHIDSVSYARWISRVKLTIGTRANFIDLMKYDYGTDRIFAFIVIWIVLLSPILGSIKLF